MTTLNSPSDPFSYLSDNPLEAVLAWGVDNDAMTNAFAADGLTNFGYLLDQLVFRVQLDSSTDFNTINLMQYTNSSAGQYNSGINVYSMDVPVPKRNYNEDLTFYWRVRHELDGSSMSTLSDYCTYSELSLNKNETIEIADAMHNDMSDQNVYTKDANSTNIYSLLKDFGNQIDLSKFEDKRLKDGFDIDNIKESELESNYGRIMNFSKPSSFSFAEYRAVLKKLFDIYSHSGTVYAIREIIKIFTGAYPEIKEYRNLYGWIAYDTRRATFVTPPLPFDYRDPNAHFFPINDLDPYTDLLVPKCMPFSKAEKAFSIDIRVKNPFGLELNRDLIADAVYKMKPCHTKIYLYIENSQGLAEIYSYLDYSYSGTFYWSSEGN